MERARTISKSMISYLRRAREHKEFLLKETKEFERGKRHLANIMGVESQEMTQSDIDDAIKYLFPSGLFDKKARPMMKHPDLLYKAQKGAQFDQEGRPNHYLFYTTLPNYYEYLTKITQKLRELNNYEDKQLSEGILDPPSNSQYQLVGRTWLSHNEMCDKMLEQIKDFEYDYIIRTLEQLRQHPYSMKASTFIDEFTREVPKQSINIDLPELIRDEKTGQIYTILKERSRECVARIKTVINGTGFIRICDKDILYFDEPYIRAMIYHPLRITRMQDKVDIEVDIVRKGHFECPKALAVATRLAVSRTLAAYVDDETRERLRLAGLLTIDTRRKERKKFGQAKARRKYTWKKR